MSDDEAAEIAREREWLLGHLRDTRAERATLDRAEREWAHAARIAGIGWGDIGEALGVSADQAKGKHGEPKPGEDPF